MKRMYAAILLAMLASTTACSGDDPAAPGLLGAGIPDDAQAMFTAAQAQDILDNGRTFGSANPFPEQAFAMIRRQLTTLYPDVDFRYDPSDVTPNLYAYETDGRKVVQLSGGLMRLQGLYYEGALMTVAFGAASLYGGIPLNAAGYSAKGQADYFAFAQTSREVWFGEAWLQNVLSAMQQWAVVFDLVTPVAALGDPHDLQGEPSLLCRLQTIQAGAALQPLPECAGGPPQPGS